MSVVFFKEDCKHSSQNSVFGICDDVAENGDTSQPAYLDENNGGNWIATVDNHYRACICFYAVDNCVTFPIREDGKSSKRCDGLLSCDDTIAFLELKSRNEYGANWVKEAERQLRTAIYYFEREPISKRFNNKRAYAVNNMRPQSRIGQAERMERFSEETGYLLFIKARIDIYSLEG